MQELRVSGTELHLQCHSAKERAERQQGQGPLRTSRKSKTISTRSRLTAWPAKSFYVASSICAITNPSFTRNSRPVYSVLFHQSLPDTANSASTTSPRSCDANGPFRRSVLQVVCLLRLRPFPAEHDSSG